MFLYTIDDPGRGEVLGGIEWVGQGNAGPKELAEPQVLDIEPA